jgi:hypothetical protein
VSSIDEFQPLQLELNKTWGVSLSLMEQAKIQQERLAAAKQASNHHDDEDANFSIEPVPSASVLRASDGELSMPESLVPAVFLKMNPELKRFFGTHIVNMDDFESTVAHLLLTCKRYQCALVQSATMRQNYPLVCSHAAEASAIAAANSGTQATTDPTPVVCCHLKALFQRNAPLKKYIDDMAARWPHASLPRGASLCILPSYLQMRFPCTLAERSVAHPQLRCIRAPQRRQCCLLIVVVFCFCVTQLLAGRPGARRRAWCGCCRELAVAQAAAAGRLLSASYLAQSGCRAVDGAEALLRAQASRRAPARCLPSDSNHRAVHGKQALGFFPAMLQHPRLHGVLRICQHGH